MRSIKEVKQEFLQIYEGITEKRGLPIVFGRIMASFFLEEHELSQKKLSKLTGYSISSVSRALDQMNNLGLITKFKNPSRENFLYKMNLNYIDLAVGGIETWIKQAEMNKTEINQLWYKIENESFKDEEQEEANRLIELFKGLVHDIDIIIDVFKQTINSIKNLKNK